MKKVVRFLLVAALGTAALLAARPSSATVIVTPYGYMGNICVTPVGNALVNWAPVYGSCVVFTPYGPVYGQVANF